MLQVRMKRLEEAKAAAATTATRWRCAGLAWSHSSRQGTAAALSLGLAEEELGEGHLALRRRHGGGGGVVRWTVG